MVIIISGSERVYAFSVCFRYERVAADIENFIEKQYNLFVYLYPRFLSMLEMIRGFLFLFFTFDSTNVV